MKTGLVLCVSASRVRPGGTQPQGTYVVFSAAAAAESVTG